MNTRRLGSTAGAAVAAIALTIAGAGSAAPAAPAQPQAQRAAAAPTCSATGVRTTLRYLRQLPPVPRGKATAILRAAANCDAAVLAGLATRDRTSLSFGLVKPAEAFAVPDHDGRYRSLVIMLTRMPATVSRSGGRTSYIWPAVQVKPTASTWRQVVTTGLMTQREATAMRRKVGGYWGWRTAINAKGVWEFDIAGD